MAKQTVFIGMRASPEIAQKLDRLAKKTQRSRGAVMRFLVSHAEAIEETAGIQWSNDQV